jgi:hypothetical protein
MQQVERHAESNNLVLLAVLLGFEQVVALMAIEYKQLVCTNNASLCMHVKVLQPVQAKFICCPAVIRDCNYPVAR